MRSPYITGLSIAEIIIAAATIILGVVFFAPLLGMHF